MTTLDEAWRWYEASRSQMRLMLRLAKRHWHAMPWDGPLGKDDQLKSLEAAEIVKSSEFSLQHLDDIAIVVLFSVFEAIVRERIKAEVLAEAKTIKHVALKQAAKETVQWIDEGSFFRVSEPFKAFNPDLVEEVNQVRRYRNWVSHGKRNLAPAPVTPKAAQERLERFIELMDAQNAPQSEGKIEIRGI